VNKHLSRFLDRVMADCLLTIYVHCYVDMCVLIDRVMAETTIVDLDQ